jgi:hypothetical protein
MAEILPQTDPSLPTEVSPLFSDTTAARGEHMRANNNKIWENFTALLGWINTLFGYFTAGVANHAAKLYPFTAQEWLTGTLSSGGSSTIALPTGYTINNTFIIAAMAYNSSQPSWDQGGNVFSGTELTFTIFDYGTGDYVVYVNQGLRYANQAYRVLIAKTP